ncbi:hypothetical protein F5Y18DRAFT_189209 [Xylariaceae sp. FL1019]|nr:hypothetical protein F5Y18DRAFT_189209 [Xylariaceae sp. FL1019]
MSVGRYACIVGAGVVEPGSSRVGCGREDVCSSYIPPPLSKNNCLQEISGCPMSCLSRRPANHSRLASTGKAMVVDMGGKYGHRTPDTQPGAVRSRMVGSRTGLDKDSKMLKTLRESLSALGPSCPFPQVALRPPSRRKMEKADGSPGAGLGCYGRVGWAGLNRMGAYMNVIGAARFGCMRRSGLGIPKTSLWAEMHCYASYYIQ